MKLGKKILLICIGVVLFFAIEYILYYIFHYVKYDKYKETLSTYEVETATDYESQGKGSGELEDYDLVADNGTLKLYAQPSTGFVAVEEKATGRITYSNPTNIDDDKTANLTNKGKLKSQMVITFYNSARTEGTYASYDYTVAISKDQLGIQSLTDGVRFNYNFKPKETSLQVIPFVISQERWEGFLEKMSKNTQRKVNKYYLLNEETGHYELIKAMREDTSLTMQCDQVKKALYDEAGYTKEDYDLDMAEGGEELVLPASFKISLDYKLDGDSVVVSVPAKLIEESNGSLATIELLPNFGAAGPDESGYILVPNGSGSLVYFNNGKTTISDYAAFIYGIDPLAADYTVVENSTKARLPLFALCREDSSILAVIEDGASLASVKSTVSGRINDYNSADFTFTLRGNEKLAMFGTAGNAATIPIVESEFYDVNLKVRYSFLGKEYTGYSGVANYYRNRLIQQGVIKVDENAPASDIPFYYDLIGAVKVTDFFAGVQYLAVRPMTTFSEAQTIANTLQQNGISNQVVNYQGWFNGGYYHDVTSRVKIISKLGGKKGLEALTKLIEGWGGKVYADVAFQKVSYISKRYNSFYESCRYYAGYAGTLGQVNPATLRQTASLGYVETLYSLVSPKYLVRYVDKFIDAAGDYGVSGFSLRDLGDVLASDKKRTEPIDREKALDVVLAQIAKFDGLNKNVLINGGNDYAIRYADDLINVPTGHNSYYGVDVEVPFYEMVYHGAVDYCGDAINLSDNYDIDDITLRLIEYGAAPHFTFTYEEANDMKYTGLNSLYSTTYTNWMDTAKTVYENVNGALKNVRNATIVKHETDASGIKKVTYSNGVVFYINNTDKDASMDGVTVKAKSYEMGRA